MISGPQSTAARGLLGWTLDDLSRESGLAKTTVNFFETGSRPSTAETVKRITAALERAGIEFTSTGVQRRTPVYHITGPDCYADLLQDVLASGATDVLIENADNSKSPPSVLAVLRELRAHGVSIRMTIEEGNTYLVLPVACYRAVPSAYFKNWVSVTYGDRVATKTKGGDTGYVVIRDADMAEAARNRFNLVWDLLKPLEIESTAHDRID